MPLKKILLRLILLILFAPILQTTFKLVYIAPLGGYSEQSTAPKFSYQEWKKGIYQNNIELFEKGNFGFVNTAIRLNHQWLFSVYGMSSSKDIVIGKDNYFFEKAYIDTRNGVDYLGKDSITTLIRKIKIIQDSLNVLNKAFLFIVAPNKADFHSKYLPNGLAPNNETNYHQLSQELIQQKINHIDLNKWFLSIKDTVSAPIFPKTGTHYSTYGAALTLQKIVSTLEQLTLQDLPDITWSKLSWSNTARVPDDDLEKTMNLFSRIKSGPYAYPQLAINKDNKYRPRAIIIGDSYYYQLIELGLNNDVFDNGRFWYYNQQIDQTTIKVPTLDLSSEVNNTDLLLIIINDANIQRCLQYFIDPMYYFFTIPNKQAKIQETIDLIYKNPEWLESIKQKAVEQNRTLEEMIYLDAQYMVETQYK